MPTQVRYAWWRGDVRGFDAESGLVKVRRLTSPRLTSPYLVSPHLTLSRLTLTYLASPSLAFACLAVACLASPHLSSPIPCLLTSPHLASPRLTVPCPLKVRYRGYEDDGEDEWRPLTQLRRYEVPG